MSRVRNHYEIIGVKKDASASEITKAYRNLCKKWHPDRNPGKEVEFTEIFKSIQYAHEILKEPESRYEYDLKIGASSRASTSSAPPSSFADFMNKMRAKMPKRDIKQVFEFVKGDNVRIKRGCSALYYGSSGYDKRDMAKIFKIEKHRITIDYRYSPGVYALPAELELSGPSCWIVKKKLYCTPTLERSRTGTILRKGYKITAFDMENNRVRIINVEFKGKSVQLDGWVSICSEDGQHTLLERDVSESMEILGQKLKVEKALRCPKGHELVEKRSSGNHKCDIPSCGRVAFHTFNCHICDYDVCYVCHKDALWHAQATGNVDPQKLYAHLNNRNSLKSTAI